MTDSYSDSRSARLRRTTSSAFVVLRAISCCLIFISSYAIMPAAYGDEPESDGVISAGKITYQKRCVFCHGDKGRGDGPSAVDMDPRPRDFVSAEYKIRSSPLGSLPSDEDLYQVIAKGMAGTAMAGWEGVLGAGEIREVVQYVKSLSDRFAREAPPKEMGIEKAAGNAASRNTTEGQRLYKEMRCFLCHGSDGRGDGPITNTLRLEWGLPFRARNLTQSWTFKGGSSLGAIYRTISTGLNGTPMGSYAAYLSVDERRSLARYVASLFRDTQIGTDVVIRAELLEGELPVKPDDPRWNATAPVEIPLGAQIVVGAPSRWWVPTANSITAKALYREARIALRLEWDDPTNIQSEIFTDGVAVKFPSESRRGAEKPHFIIEGSPLPLNIWRWNATTETRQGDVEDAPGSNSSALWKNGRWSVVISGAAPDQDFSSISFSVWDGSNRERDTAKAVSTWYYLHKHKSTPALVYLYVLISILVAVGVQWGLIRKLRNRRRRGDRNLSVQ